MLIRKRIYVILLLCIFSSGCQDWYGYIINYDGHTKKMGEMFYNRSISSEISKGIKTKVGAEYHLMSLEYVNTYIGIHIKNETEDTLYYESGQFEVESLYFEYEMVNAVVNLRIPPSRSEGVGFELYSRKITPEMKREFKMPLDEVVVFKAGVIRTQSGDIIEIPEIVLTIHQD